MTTQPHSVPTWCMLHAQAWTDDNIMIGTGPAFLTEIDGAEIGVTLEWDEHFGTTIDKEVTGRIATAIVNQSRSNKSVAESAGIPLTTFSRKMNGGASFTIMEIARIADALNIHPGKIFPQSAQLLATS